MFQLPRLPEHNVAVLYPFIFQPIFKERVWGGRHLARLFGKKLPPGPPIGESWEISDRPGDESVIANGPLAGKTLQWLVQNHPRELLGNVKPTKEGRFPLLLKILDAREKLSLQVHPPAGKAAELNGEPKTELWFIADAEPRAELYVGLKRGVTRTQFEKRIADGSVAECFHRIPVGAGDAMFLPSGRVHAIGAGLVVFEIQQNSDTTYRVFDWNRVGLDGKLRELHIPQSLASIDFDDFDPGLIQKEFFNADSVQVCPLVHCEFFKTEVWNMPAGSTKLIPPDKMKIIAVFNGHATIGDRVHLLPGQFCLIPALHDQTPIATEVATSLLCVEAGIRSRHVPLA